MVETPWQDPVAVRDLDGKEIAEPHQQAAAGFFLTLIYSSLVIFLSGELTYGLSNPQLEHLGLYVLGAGLLVAVVLSACAVVASASHGDATRRINYLGEIRKLEDVLKNTKREEIHGQ